MKTRTILMPLVLTSPALLALATPADRVAFAPEKGATVTKSFATTFEVALEDFSVVVMDEEIDPSMIGDFEITFEGGLEVSVTDEYVDMGSGRPNKLTRKYESIASNQAFVYDTAFESGEEEIPVESDLEGRSVVFTWDEEAEDFTAAWPEDEEGDDALLEGLVEDMDLRGFLPRSDVSSGDSWEAEPSVLGRLLMPGGNLGFDPEVDDADMPEEMMDVFTDLGEQGMAMVDDIFAGTVTCTYKGTREEGGTEVAVIEIKSEIASTTDFSEIFLELIHTIAEMEGGDADVDIDVAEFELEFEGEGELLWNAAEGRFQAFEHSGDATMAFAFAMAGDIDGEEGSVDLEVELSGAMGCEASAE